MFVNQGKNSRPRLSSHSTSRRVTLDNVRELFRLRYFETLSIYRIEMITGLYYAKIWDHLNGKTCKGRLVLEEYAKLDPSTFAPAPGQTNFRRRNPADVLRSIQDARKGEAAKNLGEEAGSSGSN